MGDTDVSASERVYLDAASIEPLRPAAKDAYLAALDQGWADPLRLHSDARRARSLYDQARESVAGVIGCRPDEVTFVASGTEAVVRGLTGLVRGRARHSTLLVHSAVEHSSVLHTAEAHEAAGGGVRSLPVSAAGTVPVDAVDEALAAGDAAAIAVQAANLESGAVQPTGALAEASDRSGVPWCCDLTGVAGRLPPVPGWSVATAGANAWGGPAGVGVLAVRKRVRWRPTGPADDRLDPRAPGFENVPAIVAAAVALVEMESARDVRAAHQHALTELLRSEVARRVPDVDVIGPTGANRLPHVASLSFLYVDGEVLVTELDRRGFAVASGSACTSSSLEPSHVLAAMGALTHGNVRVSVTCSTTDDDVRRFVDALVSVVADVRSQVDGVRT
ncbi:cysteine desulfurase family protein [Solicola gregarius]|uniref:Aminotransferase class V-fold PLP-dependent enzyme n=1 Tax=Solicola gregarius TaxID=2908642 RepID=A0AA46THT5_9ACTN|nr:aminotransferase class V-fold PLP-dependent enzyme [Solicola gregarius]UYM05418.1 aminotransferase class V-fold PLP-dependent enzyme [Solicola gregarius]